MATEDAEGPTVVEEEAWLGRGRERLRKISADFRT